MASHGYCPRNAAIINWLLTTEVVNRAMQFAFVYGGCFRHLIMIMEQTTALDSTPFENLDAVQSPIRYIQIIFIYVFISLTRQVQLPSD